MDRQGTWEILLLPVGETAGTGTASMNNPDPGPPLDLRGGGSALADTNPAGTRGTGGRINKPKVKRSRKS